MSLVLALAFSWKAILGAVWQATGTFILGGVATLIVKAFKKLHIDISSAQVEQIRHVAADAINYVKEQSAKRPLTPKEKLALAVAFVRMQAKDAVKDLTVEQLSAIIESLLPVLGEGASAEK